MAGRNHTMITNSGQPVQQTRRRSASIDRGRSTVEETPAGRMIVYEMPGEPGDRPDREIARGGVTSLSAEMLRVQGRHQST